MAHVVSKSELLESMVQHLRAGLERVQDLPLCLAEVRCSRVRSRPCLPGVQISFKLGIERPGMRRKQGTLLLPLSEAMAAAAGLLALPPELVAVARDSRAPDESEKEALLELGGVIAYAVEAALRPLFPDGATVRSEGCQGVRSGVRPSLTYREGDELWIARFVATLGDGDPFEGCLVVPALEHAPAPAPRARPPAARRKRA